MNNKPRILIITISFAIAVIGYALTSESSHLRSTSVGEERPYFEGKPEWCWRDNNDGSIDWEMSVVIKGIPGNVDYRVLYDWDTIFADDFVEDDWNATYIEPETHLLTIREKFYPGDRVEFGQFCLRIPWPGRVSIPVFFDFPDKNNILECDARLSTFNINQRHRGITGTRWDGPDEHGLYALTVEFYCEDGDKAYV